VVTHLAKWPEILVPLRYVLWAETSDGNIEVSLLVRKQKKKAGPLSLVHISGNVDEGRQDEATQFTQAVLEAAYKGMFGTVYVSVVCSFEPQSQASSGTDIY
jgi:hypothetical protein